MSAMKKDHLIIKIFYYEGSEALVLRALYKKMDSAPSTKKNKEGDITGHTDGRVKQQHLADQK